MTILLGIILTLIILTIVVFIHEMGHFIAARLTGMKVEEFGIGLPPLAKKLFQDSKGTKYTLNWLPIGGFVRIKGEDASVDGALEKDSFSAKKWWARSIVLIAGVTMNFILAWVIFTVLLISESSPLGVNFLTEKNYNSYFLPSIEESLESGYVSHSGIVLYPIALGTASKQGIGSGDILQYVDGKVPKNIDDFIERVKTNTPMELTLLRASNNTIYKTGIIPIGGKIQAYLHYQGLSIDSKYREQFTIGASLEKGLKETAILSWVTLDFFGKIVHDLISPATPSDREFAKEMVAGPIGMGAGMIDLIEIGISWKMIFLMIAFLSVNLGILNILPFPALDGGRLVSTTIFSIIGLFIKKKKSFSSVERWIHTIGMILLLGLSLLVAFFDILKL